MRTTLPLPSTAERLYRHLARYDDLFARGDQRECFRLYVSGLLAAPGRKNVEGLAAAAAGLVDTGANLAQSLQHFVTQSPWDHARVLARYRELLPAGVRAAADTRVVHDGVLLKRGRNSVGAQRQFARSVGRKVNCQVAVVVGAAGAAGYAPLAARLYLPAYWLREHPGVVEKTVPAEHRGHTTKEAIAAALLDELRAEGWDLADGPADGAAAVAAFEQIKGRLGLDHFEGRTWVGWHHHAAMVFAAHGFLLAEAADGR
jgi:SRSO17 transposase